ncbi:MAG: tyrosine-type recombinase/integrase [Thermodesulfobacteriota bacterium]
MSDLRRGIKSSASKGVFLLTVLRVDLFWEPPCADPHARRVVWGLGEKIPRLPDYARHGRDLMGCKSFAGKLAEWMEADRKNYKRKNIPIVHFRGKKIKSIKIAWNTAKKNAKITRKLRPYDLGHAFATFLLDQGADLKSVSEMLGHKSIETTLKVYQHTSKELHRQSIKKLPDLG